MSTTPTRWRLGHRSSLDGLRGLAVVMVVLCHVLDTWHVRFHPLGAAGVTVFFTLSGFLITSLLVEELRDTGRVSWSRFARNRVLRLFPALAVVAVLVTAYSTAVDGTPVAVLVPVAMYVANWWTVLGHSLGLLGHTWSLSIEEQFYLLWPPVLLLVRRWRHGPLVAASVGIVVSAVLRFALWDGATGTRVHYGSDTQMGSILIGCLLAILAHRGLRPISAGWLAPVGVLALGSIAFVSSDLATAVLVPTFVPLLTAAMIWAACSASGGILGTASLRYLGRRSYGWYLWHFPIVMGVHALAPSLAAAVIAAVVSLGVAELSWRYVESPFLRLKAAPVTAPRRNATDRTAPSAVGTPSAGAASWS